MPVTDVVNRQCETCGVAFFADQYWKRLCLPCWKRLRGIEPGVKTYLYNEIYTPKPYAYISHEEPTVPTMIKHKGVTLEVEKVTPAIARNWLTKNTNNRTLQERVIALYARDMINNNWHFKPVAVCFDEAGVLGNGQHTLHAIVRSDKEQMLLVARNVPRKAIAFMDMGRKRTITDIAHFVGEDFSNRKASVARVLQWGPRHAQVKSFDELFSAYQRHAEVIDFVCDSVKRISGVNVVVLAICAKAAYTCDRVKILRFLEVLRTGLVDGDHESVAIRLRDFLRSLRSSVTGDTREEVYNKTMSALGHFLDGKPVTRIFGTTTDLFPTP